METSLTPKSDSSTTIPCVNPASGEALGEVRIDDAAAVAEVVARARDAQMVWADTSYDKRRAVLRRIQQHVLDHADELCELVVRDAGKTRENAMMGEIWTVSEKLRWTIRHGEKHLRPERVSSGVFPHKKASVEFHPRGVIGVVAPWNYPLQNVLGPVIPALFAGNACIVKVSEHVAFSAARIQWIFDETFDHFGLPRDIVTLVNGYAETGAALVSAGVDLIVFTGSMGNGRKVIAGSAQSITPVILELGGKDAMIVCDDASIEHAAHAALAGSYIAAGQNCLAAERTLVHTKIYSAFVTRIEELAGQLRQGVPSDSEPGTVDVGALVTPQQLDIVEYLVEDAIRKGARAVVGGKRGSSKGNFFQPTVLVDCTPDMKIMHEETFGPIMCICRVKSDDDAVAVANGTQYALSLTVLSKDARRAKKIADRIVSGSVSINDYGLTYMVQDLPFGGEKGSGFGRLNGRDGLRACTNQKAVLEDRIALHMPAKIFPVGKGDYDVAKGVIRVIYGAGLRGKLAGAADLLRGATSRFR